MCNNKEKSGSNEVFGENYYIHTHTHTHFFFLVGLGFEALVKQALYHLSHTSSPFALVIFKKKFLLV
jgi:hypothetical protein